MKLSARDLRIGNLVTDEFYDSLPTAYKVESINEKGINLIIEDDGNWPEIADHWIEPEYKIESLRGIPLTEEWLLRFGFIKETRVHSFYRVHSENNFIIELYYDNTAKGFCFMVNSIQRKKIESIHQLQNLYHALTGEELTALPDWRDSDKVYFNRIDKGI